VLLAMLPGLRATSWGAKTCVVAYTAHDRPYIDRLDVDQGFVVAGGCGAGAKSCDEIGRIAAGLVAAGAWSYDLPAEIFAARWR
jgi:glycine/D-amino acid oxidase-like deaminating enzyme